MLKYLSSLEQGLFWSTSFAQGITPNEYINSTKVQVHKLFFQSCMQLESIFNMSFMDSFKMLIKIILIVWDSQNPLCIHRNH